MINTDLLRDESGVSAIEYVVLAALVALVLVGALHTIGVGTSNNYSSAAAGMAGPPGDEAEAPVQEPPARVPVRGGGDNRVPRR